jgi:hypothetical protein
MLYALDTALQSCEFARRCLPDAAVAALAEARAAALVEAKARAIALAAKETRENTEKLGVELSGGLGVELLRWRGAATSTSAPPQDDPSASPYTTLYAGLLESVRSGAIRPLRGRFVAALHKHGGRLKRRQDLPEEAFWTYEELKAVAEKLGEDRYGWLFVALSYRWLSADHPDPDGFHLAIIAEVAALYLKGFDQWDFMRSQLVPAGKAAGLEGSDLTTAFEEAGLDPAVADFALFWDFASLTQKPRTDEEELLFMPGLTASNIWYGHLKSLCWMQITLPEGFSFAPFRDNKTGKMRTPAQTYEDSGWCFIESIISAGIKKGVLRLDLGQRTVVQVTDGGVVEEAMGKDYAHLAKVAAKRPAPILPSEAARLLREVKIFTAGSDVDKVIDLYRSFFEGVSQSTVELNFDGLEWGDAEAVQLAAVLPSFVRLETLNLWNNQIGDAGAAAVAEAIAKEGAFPSLTDIDIGSNIGNQWFGNPASNEAKKAVYEALHKNVKQRG